MATVYTIRGTDDGDSCHRVPYGRKRGCTIALCPGKSKRGKRVMKFRKGSVSCR